jgi:hypothetical protein
MTIASRAYIEWTLVNIKKVIEDLVMKQAREGKRSFDVAVLPCHTEQIPTIIEWMKSEGLKVEHKKWMDKGGFGCVDDDELVEHSKYVISF